MTKIAFLATAAFILAAGLSPASAATSRAAKVANSYAQADSIKMQDDALFTRAVGSRW